MTRSNLADQCETEAVVPTVVGQALVGQAGAHGALERDRVPLRRA